MPPEGDDVVGGDEQGESTAEFNLRILGDLGEAPGAAAEQASGGVDIDEGDLADGGDAAAAGDADPLASKKLRIGELEVDEDDVKEGLSILQRRVEAEREIDDRLALLRNEAAKLDAAREEIERERGMSAQRVRDVQLAARLLNLFRTNRAGFEELAERMGSGQPIPPEKKELDPDAIRKTVRDEVQTLSREENKARVQGVVSSLVDQALESEPLFKGAEKRFKMDLFDEMGAAAKNKRYFLESSEGQVAKVFQEILLKMKNEERRRIQNLRGELRKEQADATRELPAAVKTSGTPAPRKPASTSFSEEDADSEDASAFNNRMQRMWSEYGEKLGGM